MRLLPISIVLILLFFSTYTLSAQTEIALLKIALIEKFVKYTTWPSESEMLNPNTDFIFYVYGEDSFNGRLEKVLKNRKFHDKTIQVKHISKPDEVLGCNLLFLGNCTKEQLKQILAVISNKPILVVSDSEGFAAMGTNINIYERDTGTLHFEINSKSVKNSQLKIDILLMEYAKIIK